MATMDQMAHFLAQYRIQDHAATRLIQCSPTKNEDLLQINFHEQSTRATGDLVSSAQHVLLTRPFIGAVYWQQTADLIALEN